MSNSNSRSPRRRNKISGQFAARLIEMLELPAYQALSRAAHLVISRIEIELAHHAGNDNGRLPVTKRDFIDYGVHHDAVAPAIREAQALGFIQVTERGRGGNAEHRSPNMFRLTFAFSDRRNVPTHEWRRIKTIEEAEQIATQARNAKSNHDVARGKRTWQKRSAGNLKPPVPVSGTETAVAGNISRYRKPPDPVPETGTETAVAPVPETGTTGSSRKPVPLSISWYGRAQPGSASPKPKPAWSTPHIEEMAEAA